MTSFKEVYYSNRINDPATAYCKTIAYQIQRFSPLQKTSSHFFNNFKYSSQI